MVIKNIFNTEQDINIIGTDNHEDRYNRPVTEEYKELPITGVEEEIKDGNTEAVTYENEGKPIQTMSMSTITMY